MNHENTNRLHQKYPKLYRNKIGFDCCDGWFDLIDRLSQKLESLIADMKNIDEEWMPRASQVKEKFGVLRFYMTTETDEIVDEIEKAEKESEITCERCGNAGSMKCHRWMYVSCEKCSKDK